MKAFLSAAAVFLIFIYGCSSDSDPVGGEQKSYDVKYEITSNGAAISEVKYLNHAGDTLTAANVNSGWSYTWTQKGNSGDETYIKITLVNTSGKGYLKILADNSVLLSDSVEGFVGGKLYH